MCPEVQALVEQFDLDGTGKLEFEGRLWTTGGVGSGWGV